MPKIQDLTGCKFGYLTVQSFAFIKNGRRWWNCVCSCGKETTSPTNLLTTGQKVSCGCYKKYVMSKFGERQTKHHFTNHPIYNTYQNMKARCLNKKHKAFKNYGGRGITICDEWLDNPQTFINWSLKNGWKEGLTLDRINVNKGYEPSNCRWATRQVQCNNTRRNVLVTFNGKTLTASEWSELNGWEKHLVSWRLRNGWSIKNALTIQPKIGNRYKQKQ